MTMAPAGAAAPKQFKSQPWILYDTVASTSFLLGSTTNAIGATTPAFTAAGEMSFFNSPGRTRSTMPWYTNLDTPGRLSFGIEVWQIYCRIIVPAMPLVPSYDPDNPVSAPTLLNVPPTHRLAEAILNYSVLELNLGQELQFQWPTAQFPGGGGLVDGSGSFSSVNNGWQVNSNVMKLPEPIEMPNTQNLDAKLKLSTEVRALIGDPATPGVGAPLAAQDYLVAAGDTNALQLPPYAVQVGLVGRRVKFTQYGQVP